MITTNKRPVDKDVRNLKLYAKDTALLPWRICVVVYALLTVLVGTCTATLHLASLLSAGVNREEVADFVRRYSPLGMYEVRTLWVIVRHVRPLSPLRLLQAAVRVAVKGIVKVYNKNCKV